MKSRKQGANKRKGQGRGSAGRQEPNFVGSGQPGRGKGRGRGRARGPRLLATKFTGKGCTFKIMVPKSFNMTTQGVQVGGSSTRCFHCWQEPLPHTVPQFIHIFHEF